MTMVQTLLNRGTYWLTTWLPKDKRVKKGSILTLEKTQGKWEVVEQYSTTELSNINRGWDNNY